jgi:ABC-type transporter Mla subunit MlaD
MDQLNGVAQRVNSLLDTVEEPIQAFVPQITRTIRTADALVEQLSGPIERVAPGLGRLADTLSNPTLLAMPKDLGEFMETLADLARRLAPLGQLAESAGSMFGLRPLAVLRSGGGSRPTPPPPVAAPAAVKKAPAPKKATTKKATTKKATTKKATTKATTGRPR